VSARTPLRRGLHDERGMTLVEQLITMTISIVVLFSVLQVADAFSSGSAASNKRTDAEDRMRTEMGTFVRNLRQAPPVNAAAAAGSITPLIATRAGDIIFRSPREATGWIRYCTGPAAGSTTGTALRVGTLSGTYVDPGTSCPDGISGAWTYGTVATGLRETESLFAYDACPDVATVACAPATVGTITMRIAMEHGEGRILRLTSSVTPRNLG
jgi:type II secretory pathway pseudopilin PulG